MFWLKKGDSRRQVILHYHFFKNAGTTIESVLKDNFRTRFAVFDGDSSNATIGNVALLEFLAANPELKAVSSHHLRPPKPKLENFVFHDIIFLRHPLARLWSTYEFYRRSSLTIDRLSAVARTRTAREFFELLPQEFPSHVENAQVSLLLHAGGKKPTEADLLPATELIKQAAVIGAAEWFDESAVAGEYFLGKTFPKFDFSYYPQNVTGTQPVTLETQFERFQKNCGKEVFERILELNQLDIAMLEIAKNEIMRRFHLVPDCERRLEKFRERCTAREGPTARIIVASNHPNAFACYANLSS